MASGVGVAGRLASGVVQVGEKLRILPGDETAVVRSEFPPHGCSPGGVLTIVICSDRKRGRVCPMGGCWVQCDALPRKRRPCASKVGPIHLPTYRLVAESRS